MFTNDLKLIYRHFKRQKIYSLINLSGLAVGMACCILILTYVRFELSFDRFHKREDRIYRLVVNGTLSKRPFDLAATNGAQAPGVAQSIPEIEEFTRFSPLYRTPVRYEEIQHFEENILWADASIFEIFSFPLIKGDPQNALKPAYSAVLTETAAGRYFGREDPVGKTIIVNDQDQFTITGIMADVPGNSHLQFDMLFSFKTYQDNNPQDFARWMGNFGFYSYLLLREDADSAQVEAKFVPLVEQHIGPVLKIVGGNIIFRLQPLKNIHLRSHLSGEISSNPNPAYLYIFSAIALIILALACINFTNLATARSSVRAREVGIRKVHGAARKQLIRQFLGESLVYSLLSLIMALFLVQLALPTFRAVSGRPLSISYLEAAWLIPTLLGLALLVGLAAGSYPAFVLAAFRPSTVLRSGPVSHGSRGSFRALLVTFQFTVSITLLIGTGVIYRQLHFMKNKRLGFDQQHVVVLRFNDDASRGRAEIFKQELRSIPAVAAVGGASHVPGWGSGYNALLPEGFNLDESIAMNIIHADHDFLSTLGAEIAVGRDFSLSYSSDAGNTAIINQAAARAIGWEDDPLGKVIRELDGQHIPRTIVGVAEDYHFRDVRASIEPLVIFCDPAEVSALVVRLQPGNLQEHLRTLQGKWETVNSGTAFDYYFLDQSLENQYRSEERLGRLFSSFSGLAVFIACLGMFGMAAFAAQQRTREMGIRKVLGASSWGLVVMMSRDLARFVLLANVIAWPLAYWLAGRWLQAFAYRTSIQPLIFFLAAMAVFTVVLMTTAWQSIKAVRADPAKTLQHE